MKRLFITFVSVNLFRFPAEPAAELGDYDPRHHQNGYVSEFRFLPTQVC